MQKLSKADIDRRETHYLQLYSAKLKIESAMAALQPLIDAVNKTIDEYNEVLSSAIGFAEDIYSEQDLYYNSRSDNWQESDRGAAYDDWLAQWQWEPSEVRHIGMPEMDIDDHGQELMGLPTNPEG